MAIIFIPIDARVLASLLFKLKKICEHSDLGKTKLYLSTEVFKKYQLTSYLVQFPIFRMKT